METKPTFDGNEGSFIEVAKAKDLHQKHLKHAEKQKIKDPTKAQFFGKTKLDVLLKKSGSVGIRIYYGRLDDDTPELILVAVDENGNDIVLDRTALKDAGDDYLSNGPRCPYSCGN